jgi:hypothetical protein
MNKSDRKYLISLLQAWADNPTAQDAVPIPLPSDVNADKVRALLASHHVEVALGPFLPLNLHNEAFRKGAMAGRQRTGFLLMELERILPSLTWETCQPVVLKGAALATTLYPDALHRWFVDLDILVPRRHLEEACRRLEAKGYHQVQGLRDPLYYDRHHFHRIFNGPQGSVLELHWDVTTPHSIYGFDVEGVFDRALPARVGKVDFQVAAPVDQVLHGVYQNIADGYIDLRRVMDMALLMQILEEDDWLYLMKESARIRMGTAFGTWLHVVKDLLGRETPVPIPLGLIPGWATRRALDGLDVAGGLLERSAETVDGYSYMLHLLFTPNTAKRLREIKRQLFPGEEIFMDSGHRAGQMPPWPTRIRSSLYHTKRLVISGWRAFRAIFHSPSS